MKYKTLDKYYILLITSSVCLLKFYPPYSLMFNISITLIITGRHDDYAGYGGYTLERRRVWESVADAV